MDKYESPKNELVMSNVFSPVDAEYIKRVCQEIHGNIGVVTNITDVLGVDVKQFKWNGKQWEYNKRSFRSLRQLKVFTKRNKRTLFVEYSTTLDREVEKLLLFGKLEI